MTYPNRMASILVGLIFSLTIFLPKVAAQTFPEWYPRIVLNSQGTHLAMMTHDSLRIYDMSTDTSFPLLGNIGGELYPPIAWDYSGTKIAFVHNGDVEVWDNVTDSAHASKLSTIKYYSAFNRTEPINITIDGLDWSLDDTQLAIGVGGFILFWDVEQNILVDQYSSDQWAFNQSSTSALSWISNDLMVIGDRNGIAHINSISQETEVSRFIIPLTSTYYTSINTMMVSNNKDKLVFAEGVFNAYIGAIYIWDFTSSTEFYNETPPIYMGHSKQAITAMAWSPDDQKIASIGKDYTLQIWDAETGETYEVIELSQDTALYSVVWSADGSEVIYVDTNGDLHKIAVTIPE